MILPLLLLAALQDIPDHPDKIRYDALRFEAPDAASMRTVLSNVAVAYLLEDRKLPLVRLSIMVRAGGFWEPEGKEGLASMTGALMRTAGTAARSPEQLDEELDMLAAQLSVSIGDTSGSATLNILSKDLDKGLELLAEVLAQPAFRQDKIDLLKAQTLEQLKARNDSTGSIESRESSLLFYGEYPVNRHPTKASIDSITREDLLGYHRRTWRAGSVMVAAAGDFDREEFARKLEALLAKLPEGKGEYLSIPPVTHKPVPGVYCFHKEGRQINQGRVRIGHLGLTLDHPDLHALRVMNYILGGGSFSSRLVQRVRSDEGLAYSVGSNFGAGSLYPGVFAMSFQSKSETCLYAAKLCLEVLEELRTRGPSEEEVEAAKAYYLDAFPSMFSSSFQTATTYASAEMDGYPKDYYAAYRDRISKVTLDEVRRVAKERCRPEEFLFVFVGNVEAIKAGDGSRPIRIEDFGRVTDVPLPDPLTLKRP
jgi:zinc protease